MATTPGTETENVVTQPGETPTDVAMRFLGEKFELLRVTIHDELAALNAGQKALADEVRQHIPEIAVLKDRDQRRSQDIANLNDALEAERDARLAEQQRNRDNRRNWLIALVTVGITALVATVFGILNLALGG